MVIETTLLTVRLISGMFKFDSSQETCIVAANNFLRLLVAALEATNEFRSQDTASVLSWIWIVRVPWEDPHEIQ